MKLIILAAGKGERLMPLTRNTPKPLLNLGSGLTLLETQLNAIKESKLIDEVIIVTGYLADQVDAKIKLYKENGLKIKTIYNPFYNMSNNLISLWMARHEMTADFMITNGDNVYETSVYSEVIENSGKGIFITTCDNDNFIDEDMKVIMDGDRVKRVSKQIVNEEADKESIGLAKIKGDEFCQIFVSVLDELVREEEYIKRFWLEVFNRMSKKGIAVNTVDIDRTKWQEVDFHMDVDLAQKLLGLKFEK